MIRIIGIDPGLRNTGWGVIAQEGTKLTYVADGTLHSDGNAPLSERLLQLHSQLVEVIREFDPDEAAVKAEKADVEQDNRDDGKRPQPVDFGPVARFAAATHAA